MTVHGLRGSSGSIEGVFVFDFSMDPNFLFSISMKCILDFCLVSCLKINCLLDKNSNIVIILV